MKSQKVAAVDSPNNGKLKFFLTAASSVSQMVMVGIALFTILHTTSAWNGDRLSKRAYITFLRGNGKEPVEVAQYNKDINKVDLRINLGLKNIGFNPATDLSLSAYILDRKSGKLLKYTSFYAVNGLTRDVIFDPEMYVLSPADHEGFVLVLYADYFDPIIGKKYHNFSLQPYSKITNGILSLDPVRPITKKEESKILIAVEKVKQKFQ